MGKSELLYPIFKLIVGVMCLVLGVEYGWAYIVLNEASFGILYIGDMLTWLMAGAILFFEGLYSISEVFKSIKGG